MNRFTYGFLLYLLTLSSVLAAQLSTTRVSTVSALTANNPSRFLTRLSPDEGLSQSYVSKIVQDPQGFIWIATDLGLNRYDGYQVQQIAGPNDVFSKSTISTLFIDKQGYLWVSTLYSGLYRVNTNTLVSKQFFTGKFKPNSPDIAEVIAIKQANDHALWLAISGKLFLMDSQTGTLTHYLTLKTRDDIFRALLVKDNWLFCATSQGLYRINITNKKVEKLKYHANNLHDLDVDNSKSLIIDKKLGLLIGTVKGLYNIKNYDDNNIAKLNVKKLKSNIVENTHKRFYSELIPELNIWRIIADKQGYLVATDKGLYHFNTETNQLKFILKFSDTRFQITDDNILDVFKDRSDNLWLASKSQGVLIWSPLTQRFSNISASTSVKLSHDNVWSLFQDKNDILWIGTDNGLNRLDLSTNIMSNYLTTANKKSVSGDHVITKIFPNSTDENLLWLVNDKGLRIFNKTTGKSTLPFYTLASKKIIKNTWLSGYYVLDNQRILFFTEKSHYIYNSNNGKIKVLTALNDVVPAELSWSFLGNIGSNKNEVLLTTSGQLFRYNLVTKKTVLIYKTPNFQPQNYDFVDNFILDDNNILWLTMSGEALIGLDNKTLKEKYRIDNLNGLKTNNIYAVQQGIENRLWFSSQMGLYRFTPKTHHIESFTVADGLFANEFNSSAFTKLHDGRLVFGSTRGITFLSPTNFSIPVTEQSHYQVHLSGIEFFSAQAHTNVQLKQSKNITLDHQDYGLKIHFSTLQFLQQNNTPYNIDLAGPAPLHFQKLIKNELLLSKLPVGKYQLTITAINPLSGKLSQPLIINITSLAAPWWSTVAKLTYALIFFLIVFSFIRVRANQRRKLQQEHEKLQASQKQMQLALNASNSGIWDYQIDKNLLFESASNSKFQGSIQRHEKSLQQHFAAIHHDEREQVRQQWLHFIEQGDNDWDVSFRMKTETGRWQWFREIGAVIKRDEQDKPLRVSGTYTNITQEKVNDAQMLLFGEAFRQINDWVLILDARKRPVTANKAFMSFFATEQQKEVPTLQYFLSLIGEQKYQQFSEIIDDIKAGQSWQGEEVIATKANEQHPVLVKINAIAADGKKINHYVIVISDISMQKNAEDKLRHLAHYDYLTNLPNRKLILEKITHTITEHKYSEHKSALFFIDLDKFKQVNDSLGHHAGDELLKHVADTLIANVKSRDLVARQSGDEFMILIERFKHFDDLTHLAQRINNCLAKPLKILGSQINISSSIGIAIFPDDATDSTELIRKADLAMIHAKQSGRSQFQFYTQQMNAQAQRRLELENELIKAVKQNDLVNFYQPIVNCASKTIVGFELLMRWPHKNGMISPMEFIPVAEEIGLISVMTEQALDRALRNYPLLQRHYENCYISVNLSAIHILQQGLCQTLKTLLNKHQLPATALRLEITEGTLLVDKKTALHRLNELKTQGFKLLLDDFGTGYSSLTYLSQFPIDVLKIDQSFVRHIQSNPMNKPIIQAIVSLANSLSLSCIAEGIEDLDQLDYIRALGCEYIQGYYFSKPAAIETITTAEFFNEISDKLSAI